MSVHKSIVSILFAFLVFFVAYGSSVKIPPEFKICYRDDPKLSDCIKDSIQSILPKLNKGFPSLDFPKMDPFVTEDANLNYSVANAFVGKVSVYELFSYGLTKGQVRTVSANITSKNALKLSVDIWFPEGVVKGNYEGLTRVGLLPFHSGGPFNVNASDVLINWKIKGKAKKVAGVEYMQVRSFQFKPLKIGNMKVKMEGIFPSKQLTKSTVKLINNSWSFFTRQLMPETQNFFGPALTEILNKIFMKIPYKDILPKGWKNGTSEANKKKTKKTTTTTTTTTTTEPTRLETVQKKRKIPSVAKWAVRS